MSDFDPKLTLFEQPADLLLALTLWGEARGEPIDGKKAVAWVVRNRMEKAAAWKAARGRNHPLYGDGTVQGVVLRPWQFSCWNKGDPNMPKMLEAVATGGSSLNAALWGVLRAVATGVLAEPPEWPDPTFGATHYCTINLWECDDAARVDEGKPARWHSRQEVGAGNTIHMVSLNNHVFARVA